MSVLLTIVGFTLTYRQARLAKEKSAAVEDAVSNVQVRIRQQDAGGNLARASYALKVARRFLDEGLWPQVVTASNDCQDSIHQPLSADVLIDTDCISSLATVVNEHQKMTLAIEKSLDGKRRLPDVAKTKTMLASHFRTINESQRLITTEV